MAEEFRRIPVRACKIPPLGLIKGHPVREEQRGGMSYENHSLKATCPKCNRSVLWSWKPGRKYKPPSSWNCTCGYRNYIAPPPVWPEIPHILYLGHEQNQQLRIHPIRPGTISEAWNQPYSIRSFLLQASRALGGCSYGCISRGTVMDEPVFADICNSPEDSDGFPEAWDCHMAAGWTNGETSCPLWEHVKNLCQSEPEKQFLYRYLSYTKHRQFPMLLPQTRIGIAERRRPDFVAFVPFQYWKYKWIAIQLDGAHSEDQRESDNQRDAYVSEQGYEVLSIRPTRSGYLEEVRRLVEMFENWMNRWEEDDWAVMIEAEVTRSEELESSPDDIPF